MTAPALYIDFAGEEYVVVAGDEFTFGRKGDLVVDGVNRHLHRRLGRFVHSESLWWLVNDGGAIELTVRDTTTRSHMAVTPGSGVPLHFESFSIEFTAGRLNYEILVEQPGSLEGPDQIANEDDSTNSLTLDASSMPLSENQFALICACAQPLLENPNARMPTSAELAAQLGWSVSKFNRQLDTVCGKFARMGFSGLHGGEGAKALDRKRELAELSINLKIVIDADLEAQGRNS